jgi:DNA repair exonuclease SbcCD ATPase subunit
LAWKESHDVFKSAAPAPLEPVQPTGSRMGHLLGGRFGGILPVLGGFAGIVAFFIAVILLVAGPSPGDPAPGPARLPDGVLQQLADVDQRQRQIQEQVAGFESVSQRLAALESGATAGPASAELASENKETLSGLDKRVKTVAAGLTDTRKQLDQLSQRLSPLDPLPPQLAEVNKQLAAVSAQAADTRQQLDQLSQRLAPLDPLPSQLAKVDPQLQSVSTGLTDTRQQLEQLASRLESLTDLPSQLTAVSQGLSDLQGQRKAFQEAQLEAMSQLQVQIDALKGDLAASGEGSESSQAVQSQALTQFQTQMQALQQKVSAAVGSSQQFEEQQLQVMAQFQGRMDEIEAGQQKLSTALAKVDQRVASEGSQTDPPLQELEKTLTSQIAALQSDLKSLQKKTRALERSAKRTAVQKAQVHRVRPGETLYMIARRYDVTVTQLRRYNSLSKKATIYPGQQLVIRPAKSN